jgi:hypothetical protein
MSLNCPECKNINIDGVVYYEKCGHEFSAEPEAFTVAYDEEQITQIQEPHKIPKTLKGSLNQSEFSSDVIVCGTRASGRTSYLGALTQLKDLKIGNISIHAKTNGEESEKLAEVTKEILATKRFSATRNIGRYQLLITIDQKTFLRDIHTNLFIYFLDIPQGDPFQCNFSLQDHDFQASMYLKGDYDVLIVLDSNSEEQEILEWCSQFLVKLQQLRLSHTKRIAIALGKCDNIEIYTKLCKLGAEKLFKDLFPLTYRIIQAFNLSFTIEYFAMSNLGMTSTKPLEPNAIREESFDYRNYGVAYVLKNPQTWRPFGLISPLYWLSTGKRHPKLDKEYLYL